MSTFTKDQLDQLRDGLQEFKATRFQKLYDAWKELGDSAVLGNLLAPERVDTEFAAHCLEHEYPKFTYDTIREVA